MTHDEALAFFGVLFNGAHHIPRSGVVERDGGWSVTTFDELESYDGDSLTRLVFLAHDQCVRVSVQPASPRYLRIVIWPRSRRDGGHFWERHPTVAAALSAWRDRGHEEVAP